MASNARAAKRRQIKGGDPVAGVDVEMSERDTLICDALEDADEWDIDPRLADFSAEKLQQVRDAIGVQNAFMDMLRLVKSPIDERGRTYDLRFLDLGGDMESVVGSGPSMGGSVMRAIFYTMTLLGFRRNCSKCGHHEKSWIKPRHVGGGFQTWVDIDAPLTAEEQLRPEHKSNMINLPPDVRALAARRDGDEGLPVQVQWHTKAEVSFIDEPRPEDWTKQ